MLRVIPHKNINKVLWDHALNQSELPLPYCYSWYLDIACPDWDAITDDNYTAIAPLPFRKKAGIRYVYQPFFTQQFGLFVRGGIQINKEAIQNEYLSILKNYAPFVTLQLNTLTSPEVFTATSYRSRTTYQLNLKNVYPSITSSYNENLKRNLKKYKGACEIKTNKQPDNLIQLFRSAKGHGITELRDADYNRLSRLIEEAVIHKYGMVWEAWISNRCIAAAFILYNHQFAINLFNASDVEGRTYQAMSVLFDHIINHFSGSERTLDFEGSDIPGVAAYYRSFGASPKTYWNITFNQLPWHLRLLKKLKDGT